MSREIWKFIGNDNKYFISNSGDVYAIRSKKKMVKYVEPITEHNYVYLYNGGSRKQHYIHDLVAEAFMGYVDDGNTLVYHLDQNPHNNFVMNLKIKTLDI